MNSYFDLNKIPTMFYKFIFGFSPDLLPTALNSSHPLTSQDQVTLMSFCSLNSFCLFPSQGLLYLFSSKRTQLPQICSPLPHLTNQATSQGSGLTFSCPSLPMVKYRPRTCSHSLSRLLILRNCFVLSVSLPIPL